MVGNWDIETPKKTKPNGTYYGWLPFIYFVIHVHFSFTREYLHLYCVCPITYIVSWKCVVSKGCATAERVEEEASGNDD